MEHIREWELESDRLYSILNNSDDKEIQDITLLQITAHNKLRDKYNQDIKMDRLYEEEVKKEINDNKDWLDKIKRWLRQYKIIKNII